MKLKVVIVDDEPLARNFLEKYCEKHGDIEVAGSFQDAETALLYLNKNEVDILFLDVEMPDLSGFQLLDQLTSMPKVILTAAKTDYAFDAFQYGVVNYLKKPITFIRFQEAIGKIKEFFNQNAELQPTKNIELNHDGIFIKAGGKLTRLNFEEILYIESLGDYVKYITLSKNYVTLSTLKSVEEKLDNSKFMKVHRSYIANLQKIKNIQENTLTIEGREIPYSKTYKMEILSRINVI
jgi:DNA-binding LytR/AlgR family response regulator